MSKRRIQPIHPGEHLAEFLEEYALSQYALAKAVSVPPRRINEIVNGERSISADTALRLGRFFGMQPQYWLNLQSRYDMESAQVNLGARLEREVKPLRVT